MSWRSEVSSTKVAGAPVGWTEGCLPRDDALQRSRSTSVRTWSISQSPTTLVVGVVLSCSLSNLAGLTWPVPGTELRFVNDGWWSCFDPLVLGLDWRWTNDFFSYGPWPFFLALRMLPYSVLSLGMSQLPRCYNLPSASIINRHDR